jgi:hypothetical protein
VPHGAAYLHPVSTQWFDVGDSENPARQPAPTFGTARQRVSPEGTHVPDVGEAL